MAADVWRVNAGRARVRYEMDVLGLVGRSGRRLRGRWHAGLDRRRLRLPAQLHGRGVGRRCRRGGVGRGRDGARRGGLLVDGLRALSACRSAWCTLGTGAVRIALGMGLDVNGGLPRPVRYLATSSSSAALARSDGCRLRRDLCYAVRK